jgi:hypothetical protein
VTGVAAPRVTTNIRDPAAILVTINKIKKAPRAMTDNQSTLTISTELHTKEVSDCMRVQHKHIDKE